MVITCMYTRYEDDIQITTFTPSVKSVRRSPVTLQMNIYLKEQKP
jgi:hypothetical protein